VVVVPEYTLLPEGQYPKPRDEVLAVYKALLQVGGYDTTTSKPATRT
jgi:acetyl esterase/lipase